MPKPNYGFEKRQRELAKKKKQEEKRLRKLNEKSGNPDQPDEGVSDGEAALPDDSTQAGDAGAPGPAGSDGGNGGN